MIVLTEAQLAGFGIVTREAKGSELTHAEMDNNIKIGLDVSAFLELGTIPVVQYPEFCNATILNASALPITSNPNNGLVVFKVTTADFLDVTFSEGSIATMYLYDGLTPQVSDVGKGRTGGIVSIPSSCKYLAIKTDVPTTLDTLHINEGGVGGGNS